MQIDSMKVIPIVFGLLIVLLLIWWGITGNRRKQIYIDKYTLEKLPKEGGQKHDKT